MSELNTPRLMAAAKEFNIGKDTLVDFLVSKGFSKDDLKPTSKLTEPMYYCLQQEFSSDKATKAKSDAIRPVGRTCDCGHTADSRKGSIGIRGKCPDKFRPQHQPLGLIQAQANSLAGCRHGDGP